MADPKPTEYAEKKAIEFLGPEIIQEIKALTPKGAKDIVEGVFKEVVGEAQMQPGKSRDELIMGINLQKEGALEKLTGAQEMVKSAEEKAKSNGGVLPQVVEKAFRDISPEALVALRKAVVASEVGRSPEAAEREAAAKLVIGIETIIHAHTDTPPQHIPSIQIERDKSNHKR
jgi:hypothetical protein